MSRFIYASPILVLSAVLLIVSTPDVMGSASQAGLQHQSGLMQNSR
jgi:hypothetical protein